MSHSGFTLPQKDAAHQVNLIVAPTGSVASIKIPDLLHRLSLTGKFNIVLIPSYTSLKFFSLEHVPDSVSVVRDTQEWTGWTRESPILHIALRNWVDILCLAPLSAHTMAKIAHGECDTLVTEVMRAWDYLAATPSKRIIAAPAMNTAMYRHPFTRPQLVLLRDSLKVELVGPISKRLACGDSGIGAMSEVADLVQTLSVVHHEILHASRTATRKET